MPQQKSPIHSNSQNRTQNHSSIPPKHLTSLLQLGTLQPHHPPTPHTLLPNHYPQNPIPNITTPYSDGTIPSSSLLHRNSNKPSPMELWPSHYTSNTVCRSLGPARYRDCNVLLCGPSRHRKCTAASPSRCGCNGYIGKSQRTSLRGGGG